jgi:hypothetical protein
VNLNGRHNRVINGDKQEAVELRDVRNNILCMYRELYAINVKLYRVKRLSILKPVHHGIQWMAQGLVK